MLIGYLPGAGYIVTTPTDNSKIPIVPAGQRFNVRMLRGNTVMGFVTHVLQSDVRPYSRLLLEYSREIERIVVRNAARVSAGIFAAIHNNIESDNELHRVEAGFIVLSSAGAKAGACQSLGEVGGALQFTFVVEVAGRPETMTLIGGLRSHSTREDEAAGEQVRSHECSSEVPTGFSSFCCAAGSWNVCWPATSGRNNHCRAGVTWNVAQVISRPYWPAASKASRYFSASSAAMQPEPAEVTACRYTWSITSPAANTPATEVWVAFPSVPLRTLM